MNTTRSSAFEPMNRVARSFRRCSRRFNRRGASRARSRIESSGTAASAAARSTTNAYFKPRRSTSRRSTPRMKRRSLRRPRHPRRRSGGERRFQVRRRHGGERAGTGPLLRRHHTYSPARKIPLGLRRRTFPLNRPARRVPNSVPLPAPITTRQSPHSTPDNHSLAVFSDVTERKQRAPFKKSCCR